VVVIMGVRLWYVAVVGDVGRIGDASLLGSGHCWSLLGRLHHCWVVVVAVGWW
jgi:hypothetical protein